MAKITLPPVSNGYELVAGINDRLQKIEDEFNDKVHYRNNPAAEANHFITTDIDLNSNDLLNADSLSAQRIFIAGVDYDALLQGYVQAAEESAQASALSAAQAAAIVASPILPPASGEKLNFDSVATAVATLIASPGAYPNETGVTTSSYYSQAECTALSIAYPDGGAASYIVVASGTGSDDGGSYHDAGTKQLKLSIEGRLSSKTFGIPVTSVVTQNTRVANLIKLGVPIHFETGDYLLSNTGANTDAVLVSNYTSNLDVTGDTKATFIVDQVDGDAIRIEVPSTGIGVPPDKLDWKWRGCTFDQRSQKNSLVTPFSTQFPPVNLGTSNTADALYLTCMYNDGAEKSAVKNVVLTDITTIGGFDHWTLSGGDSGLFVAGAEAITVRDCTDYGQRDAGVYLSGDDTTGTLLKSVDVKNQRSYASANGVTVKRSGNNINIDSCTSENTLIPVSLQYIIGDGNKFGSLTNNRSSNAWVATRLDHVEGVNCVGNTSTLLGHLMSDGLPDTGTFTTGTAFRLSGTVRSSFGFNSIIDKEPLYVAAGFGDAFVLQEFDTGAGIVDSTFNNISNNTISGINDAGNDTAGVGANNNVFQNNNISNCSVNRFIIGDPASVMLNISPDEGLMTLGDGSDRLKFTLTNTADVNIKGSFAIDSDTVVGGRRGGWGAVTGSTARLAFDADTADLSTTRQVLGALLKDLKSDQSGHGLIGP